MNGKFIVGNHFDTEFFEISFQKVLFAVIPCFYYILLNYIKVGLESKGTVAIISWI